MKEKIRTLTMGIEPLGYIRWHPIHMMRQPCCLFEPSTTIESLLLVQGVSRVNAAH